VLELVALSEAMREAAAMAERVAATDANVLITG
jgi:DNA-binding NtrC family response regulator